MQMMKIGDLRNSGTRSLCGPARRRAANAHTGSSRSVAPVHASAVNSQRRTIQKKN